MQPASEAHHPIDELSGQDVLVLVGVTQIQRRFAASSDSEHLTAQLDWFESQGMERVGASLHRLSQRGLVEMTPRSWAPTPLALQVLLGPLGPSPILATTTPAPKARCRTRDCKGFPLRDRGGYCRHCLARSCR